MGDGRRETGDRRRKTGDGRWETGDGRPFRIVFGPFRTVFPDVFLPFSDDSVLNLKFEISIGQGWGTAVADRRSDPSGPTAVPRPAPALAN